MGYWTQFHTYNQVILLSEYPGFGSPLRHFKMTLLRFRSNSRGSSPGSGKIGNFSRVIRHQGWKASLFSSQPQQWSFTQWNVGILSQGEDNDWKNWRYPIFWGWNPGKFFNWSKESLITVTKGWAFKHVLSILVDKEHAPWLTNSFVLLFPNKRLKTIF